MNAREHALDALLDEIQDGESLTDCLERISIVGNPLRGFWDPIQAAKQCPVTTIPVATYER